MHVITGGTTNGVEYGCMYDANNIEPDMTRKETGKVQYGFFGLANSLNDAPAIVWLNEKMEFVEGELIHCCANCQHVGRSGGGFFAECLQYGFQINDEIENVCDELLLVC